MREALFAVIGISVNVFVVALLLYTILSARAREQVNDLVREALSYVR